MELHCLCTVHVHQKYLSNDFRNCSSMAAELPDLEHNYSFDSRRGQLYNYNYLSGNGGGRNTVTHLVIEEVFIQLLVWQ